MTNDSKREKAKKYREENRQKIRAAQVKWQKEHPDKVREYADRWRKKHPEKVRECSRRSYNKNKEKVLAKQREYQKSHRAEISKLVLRRRKEVAEELKAKGQIWTYLSKTARENKMCKSLSARVGVSEEVARSILEEHDWNYKLIVSNYDKDATIGEL